MRDYSPIPARPIGELIAPIIANALDMSRRQRVLNCIDDPVTKKILIVRWGLRGEINSDQAELLIQHNQLEAA